MLRYILDENKLLDETIELKLNDYIKLKETLEGLINKSKSKKGQSIVEQNHFGTGDNIAGDKIIYGK